jgi:hypothetical protein
MTPDGLLQTFLCIDPRISINESKFASLFISFAKALINDIDSVPDILSNVEEDLLICDEALLMAKR